MKDPLFITWRSYSIINVAFNSNTVGKITVIRSPSTEGAVIKRSFRSIACNDASPEHTGPGPVVVIGVIIMVVVVVIACKTTNNLATTEMNIFSPNSFTNRKGYWCVHPCSLDNALVPSFTKTIANFHRLFATWGQFHQRVYDVFLS